MCPIFRMKLEYIIWIIYNNFEFYLIIKIIVLKLHYVLHQQVIILGGLILYVNVFHYHRFFRIICFVNPNLYMCANFQ